MRDPSGLSVSTHSAPNYYSNMDGSELNRSTEGIASMGGGKASAMARRYLNKEKYKRKNIVKRFVGSFVGSAGMAENMDSLRSSITVDPGMATASERTPLARLETFDEDKSSSCAVIEFGETESIWINFLNIWIGKPISLLLFSAPFAIASHYLKWGPQWIFWLNFLTMVPLASILGDFTEEAALHTGDVVGGLLNASFGNAVEVVVAMQALSNNQIRVVQSSMIGSIFSNLLLVLGCCFFFGGIYSGKKEQHFCSLNAMSGMSLLALSSIAMILPAPYADYWDIENTSVLIISRVSAFFLLISYIQLMIFQLYTHKDTAAEYTNENQRMSSMNALADDEEEKEVDEETPGIPMWMALVGLAMTTAFVTFFSDFLVESIDGFCDESGISPTFVGLIVLPIVGNGVEHITAVSVAMKDKMDLAIGVAIGSSTQIALFVVPFTVLYGWAIDKPMTLNFPLYEITLYIISIFTVTVCLKTGRSNWLLGSVLITTYVMLAIGFWFEKVKKF